MVRTFCFNGGSGWTRTNDQGIINPLLTNFVSKESLKALRVYVDNIRVVASRSKAATNGIYVLWNGFFP